MSYVRAAEVMVGPRIRPTLAGMISLRPMTLDDLPLVRHWLDQPHVARWWLSGATVDAELDSYAEAIRGDDPTLLVATRAGEPVSSGQWYAWSDYSKDADGVGARPGDCGIDYALGEPAAIGGGVGTELVAALVAGSGAPSVPASSPTRRRPTTRPAGTGRTASSSSRASIARARRHADGHLPPGRAGRGGCSHRRRVRRSGPGGLAGGVVHGQRRRRRRLRRSVRELAARGARPQDHLGRRGGRCRGRHAQPDRLPADAEAAATRWCAGVVLGVRQHRVRDPGPPRVASARCSWPKRCVTPAHSA